MKITTSGERLSWLDRAGQQGAGLVDGGLMMGMEAGQWLGRCRVRFSRKKVVRECQDCLVQQVFFSWAEGTDCMGARMRVGRPVRCRGSKLWRLVIILHIKYNYHRQKSYDDSTL
jgi:hypothetical protein